MRRLCTALPLALLLAACPWAGELAAVDEGGYRGEQPPTVLVNRDGCLRPQDRLEGPCLANPQGCARIEITPQADGNTCELCYADDGRLQSELCGAGERAECRLLEDSLGATCSICQTAAGSVLFDSCHQGLPVNQMARCELITDASGQSCEICYDEAGDVVRRTCSGTDAACEYYERNGLRCQRCLDDNGGAIETCEPRPATPDYCSSLSASDGSTCYTCYDAAGQVVDHGCSAPTVSACEEYRTADGSTCVVCYDANGGVVSRDCYAESLPAECYTYETSEGVCTICYDPQGNVTHRVCDSGSCPGQGLSCATDVDCAAGAACLSGRCACAQAPSCELFTTQDGVLCEICGDLNRDGVVDVLDATCFPEPPTPVECWDEERVTSTGASVVCTVCRSEEGGLTETCAEQRPAVTCAVEQRTDGTVCEVCRDVNSVVVHTSCSDLVCREEWLPSQGPTDQVIPCQLCERQGLLETLACDMRNTCASTGSDDNAPPPPDPGTAPAADPCGNLWLFIEPVQCGGNPWELWYREASGGQQLRPVDEGEVLREYYRSQFQPPIPVLAYRIERAFDPSFCSSCDCPRGDRIFVYVPAPEAPRLLDLGWRF